MTMDGSYDSDDLVEGLGDVKGVMDIGYKPYPSGVITHAAMDALRELVIDHDLEPEDVEEITVALDDAASQMLHHANPQTGLEAKFSIEFCLASILLERDPGIHEFTDEYVTDAETRAQTAKVQRDFEENLFGGNFANYAARVEVVTKDGAEYTNEMNTHRGRRTTRSRRIGCAESSTSALRTSLSPKQRKTHTIRSWISKTTDHLVACSTWLARNH